MRTVNLNPDALSQAGVRLSLSEWVELDPEEQDALAVAGRTAQERFAHLIVMEMVDAFETSRLAAVAEEVSR